MLILSLRIDLLNSNLSLNRERIMICKGEKKIKKKRWNSVDERLGRRRIMFPLCSRDICFGKYKLSIFLKYWAADIVQGWRI